MKSHILSTWPTLAAIGLLLITPAHGEEVPFELTPVGDDFQVNTYTTNTQRAAGVAAHDGGFIVVWDSYGSAEPEDPGTQSIQGQRYDTAGSPIGGQFQINTYTTGNQGNPAVAAWPDGRFAVVWTMTKQVRGSLFSADGQLVGDEFVLYDLTANPIAGVERPNITVTDDLVLAVWESLPGPADFDRGIVGRRYASDGTELGSAFQINVETSEKQHKPSISQAPDSSFVVTWNSYSSPNPSLQMRRLTSDGLPTGSDLQVNTQVGGYAVETSASGFAPDGSFVVAWTDYAGPGTDTSDTLVLAKRFDSSGAAVGTEFQVNTYTTGEQFLSDVVVEPGGGFIVTWEGIGPDPSDPDTAVMASRFDSAGARMGADFLVNTYTTDNQTGSTIAMDANGDFLVVWESGGSAGTDSEFTSIQGRRFVTEADVGVTKTNDVSSVEAGGQTTYEIVVTNHGPDTATNVQVTDSLSTHLTCTWTSQATNGAAGHTAMGAGDLAETLLMPASSTVTYMLDCLVAPDATGTLINTVDVLAHQVDANTSNDTATDMDSIDVSVDLALDLSADSLDAVPGETLVLFATVTNNGPASSTAGTVTLPLPSGLSFVSSVECLEVIDEVRCPFGPLAPSTQIDFNFTALVDGGLQDGSQIVQTGNVAGNEADPMSDNNSTSVTLTVATPIFADGFESGDVSAWSSTLP